MRGRVARRPSRDGCVRRTDRGFYPRGRAVAEFYPFEGSEK